MKVGIVDIGLGLPKKVVTNEALGLENPDWDMDRVAAKTGVNSRHIAETDETALDLGERACRELLARQPGAEARIDAILFCTQSPDYIMPPNSTLLHQRLGLGDDVFALDFTLACSGYIYGLTLARSLIISGTASSVLLVTADTYSRYIHPRDRSTRSLFGDGAAATLIEAGGPLRIEGSLVSTSGKHHKLFMIPAGGCRTPKAETAEPSDGPGDVVRSPEHIHMNGMGVLSFVTTRVPKHIRRLLARHGLTCDDVDLFVFHQASVLALDTLQRLLRLPAEKVYHRISDVGNTVSASIPIALRSAIEDGRTPPGTRMLLCGFGVGMSWGEVIIEVH